MALPRVQPIAPTWHKEPFDDPRLAVRVQICGLCRSASAGGVLQAVLPKASPIVSEALSVEGRGRVLFELMCAHDLEGIVCKRLADPYDPRVQWFRAKNPDYSQKEARGDLLERSNRRPWSRELYRDRTRVDLDP
jgi:hypothetical protein